MGITLPRARPAIPAAPAPEPVILGWVVVVTNLEGRCRGLTCADLMDLDTAEHEAASWRKSAAGAGGRFRVCPVMDTEG